MKNVRYEKFGVQLSKPLADELNCLVGALNAAGLDTTRSEVIETFLEFFYLTYFSEVGRFSSLLELKRAGGLGTKEEKGE